MWKAILLNVVLDLAFDYFLIAARKLADKTDNTIDDEMVETLELYRDRLIGTARDELKN